ncbi:sugar ABC transporter permease [Bradyrhizobium symbiodeficiens]|uniref:Sugar ABC transporter permease n=1 Tax=Bradyrhizobium symbiodeficiens TaxID=1404367 RepID=A0ABX5W7Z0_9BRAD|nr:sugar ABC transporter permease [Bradyrhizobium symbiodeficiens]QDF38812.1 sugar ABC transporter permease [Bradyrhizobium symbiodeficiens]
MTILKEVGTAGPPALLEQRRAEARSIAQTTDWSRSVKYATFLLPSVALICCVMLYPLGYAVYSSLFNYDLGSGTHDLIGLDNYVTLLGEARFWAALGRTSLIVTCAVTSEFFIGLFVAYGLYQLVRGGRVLSLLMFLPHIVTPVVAALFLRWIFMGRWGLLSSILISFNIFPPDWLGDPNWARFTVVVADIWQFTPFIILVLLAALNTVDESLIEAAKLDGAGHWTLLFRILVPSVWPIIAFVLVIRVMDAFRSFDNIYVLTAGGPGTATETLTMYTYTTAFKLLKIGKASALGVLTLVFVGCVALAVITVLSRLSRGRGRSVI